MALAYRGDNARSKRSYIATTAFNGSIYDYKTRLNMTTVKNEGQLTALTLTPAGAAINSTNCPAGRILRELGNKLYPGVHPGLAVGDTYNGAVVGTTATNHMWVNVFDDVTGVRGFIDPNNSIFAVYNSDKSVEIVDAGEQAGGAPTRLGQPVYTAGLVSAGTTVSAGTSITAGTSVSAANYLVSSSIPLTVYATGLANVVYSSGTGCDVFINPAQGGGVYTLDLSPTTYNGLNGNINIYAAIGGTTGGSTLIPAGGSSFPAGTTVILLVTSNATATTGGGSPTGPQMVAGTKVKQAALRFAAATAAYATITYISNGTNLIQTSSALMTA